MKVVDLTIADLSKICDENNYCFASKCPFYKENILCNIARYSRRAMSTDGIRNLEYSNNIEKEESKNGNSK